VNLAVWVRAQKIVARSSAFLALPVRQAHLVPIACQDNSGVGVTVKAQFVVIVLWDISPGKQGVLRAYPAFLVHFKTIRVNLHVNSALKIRKVKKQIRPNAIPVALAKSQKKAVLNALNVRLEERALAAKSVWKIFIVIQQ
jgi:hypothetical protein